MYSGHLYHQSSYLKQWKWRFITLTLCQPRQNTYWISVYKRASDDKNQTGYKLITTMEITVHTVIESTDFKGIYGGRISSHILKITNVKLQQCLTLKSQSKQTVDEWKQMLVSSQNMLFNRQCSLKRVNNMKQRSRIIQLFIMADFLSQLTSMIEVDSLLTVQELKLLLCDKYDLLLSRVRLSMHSNKKPLLKNELTLFDYNICNLCTLCVHTLYYQINININFNQKIINGEDFGLDCNSSIADIKKQIEKKHHIPVDQQCLVYNKMELRDEHKLYHYALDNGRTLRLVVRESQLNGCLKTLVRDKVIRSMTGLNSGRSQILCDLFWFGMPKKERHKLSILRTFQIVHRFKQNMAVYQSILKMKAKENEDEEDDDEEEMHHHRGNRKERVLFHGCSQENIEKIIYNGFDRNYNVRSVYGKGTYFTSDPLIAMKYCKQDEKSGSFVMFVCRVYVGSYCRGYPKMKTSALYKEDKITQYDSLVNDRHNPTIFVINRDYHAVPVNLIEFKIQK